MSASAAIDRNKRDTVEGEAPSRAKSCVHDPCGCRPMIVASWNIVEFSAIAFARSSRGTSSEAKAWRAGASKALATPRPKSKKKNVERLDNVHERDGRENKCEDHHDRLRDDQEGPARYAIGNHAAIQREQPARIPVANPA